MSVAQGGQTAKQGVYEDHSTVAVNGHIVNVQIASGVACLRDVQTIATIGGLTWCNHIFETPHLIE